MTCSRGRKVGEVNKSRGMWCTWWWTSRSNPATASRGCSYHQRCQRDPLRRQGGRDSRANHWRMALNWRGEVAVGLERKREPLALASPRRTAWWSEFKGMALELPKEPSVRPPEEGAGEPDICMGLFLRGDKTLASLEKLAKSAKTTFDRGGVEVGEGDCTGEQLLDWTLAVCKGSKYCY